MFYYICRQINNKALLTLKIFETPSPDTEVWFVYIKGRLDLHVNYNFGGRLACLRERKATTSIVNCLMNFKVINVPSKTS